MKRILFILILLYSTLNYSQFGIGKDISIAKNEIKEIFKKNNFKFIKETKHFYTENSSEYDLLYKEGFWVNISYNKYENCNLVQIIIDSKNKKKLYEKILLTFNFSKWTPISSDNSSIGLFNFYEYKKVLIETKEYSNPDSFEYTIIFSEK